MAIVNTIYEKNMQRHLISKGALDFYFLPGGGLYEIRRNNLMINLFSGTIFDYSPTNIYLRVFCHKNGINSMPLLGPGAVSKITASKNSICAEGHFKGINYRVDFFPGNNEEWFWKVTLKNNSEEKVVADLVYYQDVAISNRDAVRRNEYYISQYIDHRVIEHKDTGFVLCSRQNEKVEETNPLLITACLGGASSFLSDGSMFYGASCRETAFPSALSLPEFDNKIYQGEFACHCLVSAKYHLEPNQTVEEVFFSRFVLDHEPLQKTNSVSLPEPPELKSEKNTSGFNRINNLFTNTEQFPSLNLTPAELDEFFPGEKLHLEENEEGILSFFTQDDRHIVLKRKELSIERPHGHMLRFSRSIYPEKNIGASTVWMNGVFASHISYGNTSFNQCVGNVRSTWNLLKSGGIRIFADNGSGWKLLGLPSAFEMSFNSARWLYLNNENLIEVRVCGESVKVRVLKGPALRLLSTINLTMGGNELDVEIPIEVTEKGIFAKPGTASLMSENAPELQFKITADQQVKYGLDEQLYSDSLRRKYPLVTILSDVTDELSLRFSTLEEDNYNKDLQDSLFNRRHISGEGDGVKRISSIFPWFIHNAMIHFSTPAGLEQYSGAAWGVRDICQGPVEMLLAMGHPKTVRQIIHTVFSHQYEHGNWPQWFMFDQYLKIQQDDSHGDVVIWPLKAVCEYIENTNDFSILDDELAYTGQDFDFTCEKVSLSVHIEKLLENIMSSFVPGTKLISYGGGDWNDSLQPLDHKTAERLVSSWTVQLLYQTLMRFVEVCRKGNRPYKRYEKLATEIKEDFNKHLVRDEITTGFALFNNNGKVEWLLLHPNDCVTGIKYRLLPVNRGILSEIFTKEQAQNHIEMAKEFLLMPDGAHLMDKAPAYDGGKCHIFKRAETATYFGREIGTNYIHAHLRFAEAMAKTGNAQELYHALLTANPVAIEKSVPNALPRQSNSYFSSSDADFSDRYQAMRDFPLLRSGKIKVKGGWRIYSSGPGIYINLLLTVLCGIRQKFDKLIIDPVIPKSAGIITLDTKIDECACSFIFTPLNREHTPSVIKINDKILSSLSYEENPYRTGGAEFELEDFIKQLDKDKINIIKVNL
jgi:1,2-beta-oligoglucan phosphorylase